MSDPVTLLLSRLDGVTEKSNGEWSARCPAHDDRNPSLNIARGDDGRVLVKCWAECGTLEVVQAVGLTLADLFVKTTRHRLPPGRTRQYPNYRKILELIKHELTVLMIAAERLYKNEPLTEREYEAVSRAYVNISKVLEAANV